MVSLVQRRRRVALHLFFINTIVRPRGSRRVEFLNFRHFRHF
jgi:hypothetical protein